MHSFAHLFWLIMHRLGTIFLLFLCFPLSVAAQDPPIDGITVGVGLTQFFGEADEIAGVDPVQHLAQSDLHLLVGADRQYQHFRIGADVYHHRFWGTHAIDRGDARLDMRIRMTGTDLVLSRGFDFFRENYVRVFVGVGPSLVDPEYEVAGAIDIDDMDRFLEGEVVYQDREDQNLYFHPVGSRVLLTTPVGIMLQDRLRLGVRLVWTDYLDGVRHEGSPWDYLTMINIGWRFGL